MSRNQFIIEYVRSSRNYTKIGLQGNITLQLRPFAYLKPTDVLEFIPSLDGYKEIYKVFDDKVLSISEMGHFLNRTLWYDQAASTSSLRP